MLFKYKLYNSDTHITLTHDQYQDLKIIKDHARELVSELDNPVKDHVLLAHYKKKLIAILWNNFKGPK